MNESWNDLWPSLWLSLEIATAATVIAALLAIPLAFLLARTRFPGKSLLEAFLIVPLVLPPTVVGYLLLIAFGRRSPLGDFLATAFNYSIIFRVEGAILAAAIVALPLLYLPAKAAFQSIDPDLEDTARLHGATRLQMFWQISLPLATRAIASGLMLAFARALGEFGATVMVFGWQPNHLTLPISIYADFEDNNLPHAAPAVIALLIISLALTLAYNRATRRS